MREIKPSEELLLYVHVPFCISKCHFCFKTNEVSKGILLNRSLYEDYVNAVVKSIAHHGPILKQKYQAIGMNWGGGTPTVLGPTLIIRLAKALQEFWDLSEMYFSVEATPESLNVDLLKALSSIGVNRLSIGVQSFNNNTLAKMGRHHTREQVIEGVKLARKYGFTNINLDLIVSFPDESIYDAIYSIKEAIDIYPPHITTYFYHPTPGTILLNRILKDPHLYWSREQHINGLNKIRDMLEDAGYSNYEFFHWSNAPNKLSYVSLDHYYGHKGDVFGFGAEAQSFIAGMGNIQTEHMPTYLQDPFSLKAGKYDLEYSLERSLGCRFGLNYSALARTFGLTRETIIKHPLVKNLSTVSGVIRCETGLYMDAENYMREHTLGVQGRLGNLLALPSDMRKKMTEII